MGILHYYNVPRTGLDLEEDGNIMASICYTTYYSIGWGFFSGCDFVVQHLPVCELGEIWQFIKRQETGTHQSQIVIALDREIDR